MTYKDMILYYIIKKYKLILDRTNINYIELSDIEDVQQWTEKECRSVWEKMYKEYIQNNFTAAYSCPWCIYFRSDCDECNYAHTHGICELYEINTFNSILGCMSNKEFKSISKQAFKQTLEKKDVKDPIEDEIINQTKI